MNNLLKVYLKNIIFAVVIIAVLVGIGAHGVSSVSETELRKSTYTRTEFDFHIAAPNAEQVAQVESNPDVKSVFPYYAYKKAFGNNNDIMLLTSDRIEALGASVLTEGTLIEGSFDKDGAMIDKTAADELGLSVGDNISFTLLGRKFTKKVAAIYLPSTLAIMEKGVVAVSLSGDLATVTPPAAYGGAFIVANDRTAVAASLGSYVGEGNVALTYEQYVAIYCSEKRPGQSDEEYETACKEQYETYRKNILSSALLGGGQVVDKMDAYNLVKQQTMTTENSLRTLMTLTAIASFAVFAVVCIIFTFSNKENDVIRRDEGEEASRMILDYSLAAAFTALAISAITAITVFTLASATYFTSECIFIILSTALPVLAGIPVVAAAAFVYVQNLYRNRVVIINGEDEEEEEEEENERFAAFEQNENTADRRKLNEVDEELAEEENEAVESGALAVHEEKADKRSEAEVAAAAARRERAAAQNEVARQNRPAVQNERTSDNKKQFFDYVNDPNPIKPTDSGKSAE